jgi:hypothetical protein
MRIAVPRWPGIGRGRWVNQLDRRSFRRRTDFPPKNPQQAVIKPTNEIVKDLDAIGQLCCR